MKKKASTRGGNPLNDKLRAAALKHADVEQAIACAGTKLESASFKIKGKAFLFLRPGTAMVKLDDSLDAAIEHEQANPDCCQVGAKGWVTIKSDCAAPLHARVLQKWLEESYRLMAGPKGR